VSFFRSATLASALGLSLYAAAPPSEAHHSFAMFDLGRSETLEGRVKEMQWVNPHTWLQVLVTGSDGKEVEWSFESTTPSALYAQGWRKSAVRAGDSITVTFHPLLDGRPGGSLVSAVLADGTKLPRAGTTRAANE
jgi:hypothetical protein